MTLKEKRSFPSLKCLPLPGLYEDSRHTASRIQDLVNLHLCLAIYSVLFFGVNHHHIIHHWKFIVPLALGTKTNLIAVMLNLRFMPQGCLYLKEGREKKKIIKKKSSVFFICSFCKQNFFSLFCKPLPLTSLPVPISLLPQISEGLSYVTQFVNTLLPWIFCNMFIVSLGRCTIIHNTIGAK